MCEDVVKGVWYHSSLLWVGAYALYGWVGRGGGEVKEGEVPVERNMKRKHIVFFTQVVSRFSLALTLHGVRLSCPSLSVGKDGAIVSLQH